MPGLSRPRRVLAAATCCGLVAALAWLPAGPASAIAPADKLSLAGNVNFSTSGPACTEVGTEPSQSTPFAQGSASASVSMDTTVTNTDTVHPDAADHTHVVGSLSATGDLKSHQGSMTSYQLSGTGNVSVVAAEGTASQCHVTATMSAGTSLSFSVATSGWVYVTRTQARKVLSEMVIETDGSTTYVDIFGGPKSTHTERVFLPPGQYVAISTFVVNSGPFLGFRAGSPTATLAGDFHVAGSALGGVRGAGRRFVALPDSISCSDRSARLAWKGPAGQVARASIRVNGRLKASVDNPSSGHSVVLRHLGKRADNTITADLTLDGGGHARASRDYLPCRG